MKHLTLLRESHGLTLRRLGQRMRWPWQSLERLEEGTYVLGELPTECDAGLCRLESGLQAVLHTTLTLGELLSETKGA